MDRKVQQVVLIAGPPGSGKTTLSLQLAEKFNFKHISAGDCLREEMGNSQSEHAQLIRSHINNGTIVPVEITLELLKKKFSSLGWGKYLVLLDGFPRNDNNVEGWVRGMDDSVCIVHAICLLCTPQTSLERMRMRKSNPNKPQRSDDVERVLLSRIDVFNNETLPVMRALQMVGRCTMIDANRSREENFESIVAVVRKLQAS